MRHTNADAMSRRPCPKKDCFCSQQISAYSDEGPVEFGLTPRPPRDREARSTSRIEESVRERPPAPTLYGPADRLPARPTSVEVKPEVSDQRDRAPLSRSARTCCKCQGGEGPCNGSPTQRLNGPADRAVIGRRRRKWRRSQAPRLETIVEVDEVPYHEVFCRGICDELDLIDFGESRVLCQEVSEGEDLIDFSGDNISCQEENEERDLIDFSEDVTQGSLLSPLAEEYQPTCRLESEETAVKSWSRSTSEDCCASWSEPDEPGVCRFVEELQQCWQPGVKYTANVEVETNASETQASTEAPLLEAWSPEALRAAQKKRSKCWLCTCLSGSWSE